MTSLNHSRFKLGILLILTTLILSSGAALSWENPDSNTNYLDDDSSYTLNASGDENTTSVEFWYKVDSGTYQKHGSGSESGNYFTKTINLGGTFADGNSVTFKANNTNDSTTVNVDIDQLGPDSSDFSITSPSDGYVSTQDPTIDVKVTDSPSGVKNVSLEVKDSSGNSEGNNSCSSNTCSISLSGLSDDTYDVNVTAYDKVNNSGSTSSLSFTVDTSYDGDSSPDFSPGGGVELLDSGEDMDITVSLAEQSSGESSDITVTCYDGDDDQFDSETNPVSGDNTDFTCNVDGDDYGGTTQDIYVKMCDAAVNCDTSDSEEYEFDAEAPTVSDLSSASGVSSFNSNFTASFSASDDVTSVEEVEYFFDDIDTDEGSGTDVSGEISDFDDAEFEVDVGSLDSGEHTLYVRAKDEAGRWSSAYGFKFDYLPGETSEVSLTVPDNVTVTAGDSDRFTVDVENTGSFYIESFDVNVSSEVFSGSDTVSSFRPNDSITLSFDVEPGKEDIGKYSMDVSVSDPSTSKSFDYRVEANQEQKSDIESQLEDYTEKLESLESNITELKQKVSDGKNERLSSNFSEFRNDVEEAESAVENGEYYRAKSALEGIDADFSTAKSSYENVKKEYESSRLWSFLFIGLGVVLVSGVGIVGYLVYEDIVDPEEFLDNLGETDVSMGSLDLGEMEHKVKNLLGLEHEADEFEWDGFKD